MHNQHLEKLSFFGFKGLLMGFRQLLISLLAHMFSQFLFSPLRPGICRILHYYGNSPVVTVSPVLKLNTRKAHLQWRTL